MTLNACHHRTRVGINESVLGLYYSSLNHERNKNKCIAIFCAYDIVKGTVVSNQYLKLFAQTDEYIFSTARMQRNALFLSWKRVKYVTLAPSIIVVTKYSETDEVATRLAG